MYAVLKYLLYSVLLGFGYSLIAISAGVIVQSSIMTLDGIYTLIGAFLSFLTLFMAKFISGEDWTNFPFGKQALTPFIIFIQYTVILIVSIVNIASMVKNILNGPTLTDVKAGLIFSFFGIIYSFTTLIFLQKKEKNHDLLDAEIEQWRFGLYFSFGVLLSFLVTFVLQLLGLESLADYLDPVVAIVITISFIVVALIRIKESILQLLHATLDEELKEEIHLKINHCLSPYRTEQHLIRMSKVGSELIIEIDLVIVPGSTLDSVLTQDELRASLWQEIHTLAVQQNKILWLNVNYTANEDWIF